MKVIYIHGVSERESHSSYQPRMRRREQLFIETVAKPLNLECHEILSAGWGHLRPEIRLSRLQETNFVTFSALSIDRFQELPDYPLDFRDYLVTGGLAAAPYVETCLLRSLEQNSNAIPEADIDAVQNWIADLAERSAIISAPGAADKPDKVLAKIRDEFPPETTSPLFVKFGSSKGVVLKLLDFMRDKLSDATNDMLTPVKERAQVELAIRWADAIWYVGGPGRKTAQSYVLKKFEEAAEDATGEELFVVLGHSLGGLVAFETINSDAFLEKKLQERGRWVLIALGSQLPVYQALEVLKSGRFRSELNHRAAFRNIVDANDPLGFHFADTEIDLQTRSGVNFVSSHMSYLDSVIALRDVRAGLSGILSRWRIDNPAFAI